MSHTSPTLNESVPTPQYTDNIIRGQFRLILWDSTQRPLHHWICVLLYFWGEHGCDWGCVRVPCVYVSWYLCGLLLLWLWMYAFGCECVRETVIERRKECACVCFVNGWVSTGSEDSIWLLHHACVRVSVCLMVLQNTERFKTKPLHNRYVCFWCIVVRYWLRGSDITIYKVAV